MDAPNVNFDQEQGEGLLAALLAKDRIRALTSGARGDIAHVVQHPSTAEEYRRQHQLCGAFAQLCTALEIAGEQKDRLRIITAENKIREFYAHCNEEDRELLATFLDDMEAGSRIVDEQRVKFHDRLGAAAALPLRFTEAFIRTSVPLAISISKQAAALAVGTLRAVYKGAQAGWQALS